jgi:hypothetical protein
VTEGGGQRESAHEREPLTTVMLWRQKDLTLTKI